MLILAYFVLLCSNFLFIKSEDNRVKNVLVINVDPGQNCSMIDDNTFEEGNITLVVVARKHLNYGWWRVTRGNDTKNLYDDIKTKGEKSQDTESKPIIQVQTAFINKSMEGIWEFEFLMLQNVKLGQNYEKQYNGTPYVLAVCRKNVTIVPSKSVETMGFGAKKNTIIVACCSLIVILFAIIVALATYIFFLKAKAQKLISLNTHNNLSKKKDSEPDDIARYCSNPRPKMMKQSSPVNDDNRESVIYEDPHLEIPSNPRSPMQPPQAPSINTMPRTPRPDHNLKVGPQAMQTSARNSPARNPMLEIQRQIQERELANRPPLPLPNQGHPNLHNAPHSIPQIEPHGHFPEEVYEEMEPEHNTYEPPPIINITPQRQPVPTKKIPMGNLLGEQTNTLNLRQRNKPPVTPKPQPTQLPRSNTMTPAKEIEQSFRKRNETVPKANMTPMQQELAMRRRPTGGPPANELEEVLRRRNNVMQVPVQSIPDPSARGSPMTKPLPASKPAMPYPVQEEIYYNENQASSDEEWTYEPLKPLNGYDENIYNNI